jgi:hypothetical protein
MEEVAGRVALCLVLLNGVVARVEMQIKCRTAVGTSRIVRVNGVVIRVVKTNTIGRSGNYVPFDRASKK